MPCPAEPRAMRKADRQIKNKWANRVLDSETLRAGASSLIMGLFIFLNGCKAFPAPSEAAQEPSELTTNPINESFLPKRYSSHYNITICSRSQRLERSF